MLTSAVKFQWVAYTQTCEVLISQHIISCKSLSTSIINDPLHPLHPYLANALSTFNTWSSFQLLRCRTSLYRNSLIPSLARHLVNPNQNVDLQSFLRSTPFIISFAENLWFHFHKIKPIFLCYVVPPHVKFPPGMKMKHYNSPLIQFACAYRNGVFNWFCQDWASSPTPNPLCGRSSFLLLYPDSQTRNQPPPTRIHQPLPPPRRQKSIIYFGFTLHHKLCQNALI